LSEVTHILGAIELGDPKAADQLLPLVYGEIRLRCFIGMTIAEAAEALGISEPAARRQWAFARAWLYREIKTQRD